MKTYVKMFYEDRAERKIYIGKHEVSKDDVVNVVWLEKAVYVLKLILRDKCMKFFGKLTRSTIVKIKEAGKPHSYFRVTEISFVPDPKSFYVLAVQISHDQAESLRDKKRKRRRSLEGIIKDKKAGKKKQPSEF